MKRAANQELIVSETENDYEIVFTHMPLYTTRSGRHVKAVSRLDL